MVGTPPPPPYLLSEGREDSDFFHKNARDGKIGGVVLKKGGNTYFHNN